MTILIRRVDGGAFECLSGHHRLRAALEVYGKATVTDVETDETFEVHEVGGQIVALKDGREAVAEMLAAISRAAGPTS